MKQEISYPVSDHKHATRVAFALRSDLYTAMNIAFQNYLKSGNFNPNSPDIRRRVDNVFCKAFNENLKISVIASCDIDFKKLKKEVANLGK